MKRKLSIVIPVYNESETINEFYLRLISALKSQASKNWNISLIFVNDGSTDDSFEKLLQLQMQEKDFLIEIVDLSRNFGHQQAVWAGIEHSTSKSCVLVMDGDLQDPPEVIPDFIEGLEKYEVVIGKRVSRKDSFWKKIFAKSFYSILGNLSEGLVQSDVGDFWAISERAKLVLLTYPEELKFLRGLISHIGFSSTNIPYNRDARFAGKTHYSVFKMVQLAIAGITGFTIKPLVYTVYVAIVSSGVLTLSALFLIYIRIKDSSPISPGLTFVGVMIITSIGLLFNVLAVLSLYIARIAIEIKRRPVYIVNSSHISDSKRSR